MLRLRGRAHRCDSVSVHCPTGRAERITRPVSRSLPGTEPLLSNAEPDEGHRLGSLDSKPCAVPDQRENLGKRHPLRGSEFPCWSERQWEPLRRVPERLGGQIRAVLSTVMLN